MVEAIKPEKERKQYKEINKYKVVTQITFLDVNVNVCVFVCAW